MSVRLLELEHSGPTKTLVWNDTHEPHAAIAQHFINATHNQENKLKKGGPVALSPLEDVTQALQATTPQEYSFTHDTQKVSVKVTSTCIVVGA